MESQIDNKQFIVSFIIIARNAENNLKSIFEDIKNQSYNHELIELILIDSMSDDKTKTVMEQFKNENSTAFKDIKVLENPGKNLPCGWNVALKNAMGDIILRIDAHSSIPTNFIENNVKCFEKGEKISGGLRTSVVNQDDNMQRTLLIAESSLFGSGIAGYRRQEETKYVDTLAHGAYAREIFENVGGYDERLFRTEDNEMHYRMREAGYKLFFSSDINSKHLPRSTFKKMLNQKYSNGYWIGLTLGVSPKCFSIYHLVPLGFVLAIIFCLILCLVGIFWPIITLFSVYFAANLLMTVFSVLKEKFCAQFLLLPFMFFLLHVAYGLGSLVGIIKLPFWKRKNKTCDAILKVKEIMKNNSMRNK